MQTKILGQVIGEQSGWDQVAEWAIALYHFVPNQLGKKFLRSEHVKPGSTLNIDFETGDVELFDEDGTPVIIRADWSVFNKPFS